MAEVLLSLYIAGAVAWTAFLFWVHRGTWRWPSTGFMWFMEIFFLVSSVIAWPVAVLTVLSVVLMDLWKYSGTDPRFPKEE